MSRRSARSSDQVVDHEKERAPLAAGLEKALERIDDADARVKAAHADYAALVRELGVAACANFEGINRQTVHERLKHWGNDTYP
jgi:hypothetical protein